MSQAARVGDQTSHPGILAPRGATNVLVGGVPAARVGDPQVSLVPPPLDVMPALPVVLGSASVLVGGQPAVRVGDFCGEGVPVAMGATNVLVG